MRGNGRSRLGAGRAGRVLAILFAARAVAAPGTGELASAPDSLKPYVLFLGTDLSVERDSGFHRVEGVRGSSFLIEVGGRQVRVPMAHGGVNLKFDQTLKLTSDLASVAKLKVERAYTPGNDPYLKFQRMQEVQNAAFDDAAAAAGSMTGTSQKLTIVGAGQTLNGSGGMAGEANQMLASHENSVGAAGRAVGGGGLASTGAMDFQEAMAEGLFDAVEVSFELSSGRPLDNPYIVVIARYHEKNGKPGVARNWIYSIPLAPLSARPEKVHFLQGGLPPGFEIENFQVHVYDAGQELATNVSPKQMALTREKAFQYMTAEYVLDHRGATLPASPSEAELPRELRERLTDTELNETVYVAVAADGGPGDVFLDPRCAQKAGDAYFVAAVKYIHFNPALENGRAVAGTAALKLGQVLR